MASIIKFPNSLENRNEVKRLREELERLILEEDNLIYIECENIRAKYIREFGSKEYKILKLSLSYQKLRRKIEVLQAKLNRKETISREFLNRLDRDIEKEFQKYIEELNVKLEEINWAADRFSNDKITGQEFIYFKKKYKELVKKLHPDLNPSIDPKLLEIFYKVVDAYKNGWSEIIDLYYELIVLADDYNAEDDRLNYKSEIGRLKEKIEKIKTSIADIKNSYPYNYKDLLDSPQETQNHKKELDDLIESYKTSNKYLEDRLKEIIENVKDWKSR